VGGQLAVQPNIIAPFGYSLWVMSNYTVSKIPELDYLCSPEKQYVKKELEIDTPQMKQSRYYILFRCNFACKDPKTTCLLKVSTTDKYLIECMRFHIVTQHEAAGAPENAAISNKKTKQAVELSENGRIIVQHNVPFTLAAGKYSLVCDILAPYNVDTSKLSVALASLPEVADFANIELEEQAEYSDLYQPYKYGVIFRERIYVPNETPVALHIRLRKGGYVKPPPAEGREKGWQKRGWRKSGCGSRERT
jgi:hypothetical protein